MPGHKGVKAIVDFNSCSLQSLLSLTRNSGGKSDLRIHILRVRREKDRLHAWIRINGQKSIRKELLRRVGKTPESYYTIIGESYAGTIVYLTVPARHCRRASSCPLATPSPKIVPVSTIIYNGEMKALIVAPSKKSLEKLEKNGFHLELIIDDQEQLNSLTDRQEEILMKAFLIGYYSYPRSADLKDLSRVTGLSVSTVAELIRKAEIKLIKRFLLEELLIAHINGNGDGGGDGLKNKRAKTNACDPL